MSLVVRPRTLDVAARVESPLFSCDNQPLMRLREALKEDPTTAIFFDYRQIQSVEESAAYCIHNTLINREFSGLPVSDRLGVRLVKEEPITMEMDQDKWHLVVNGINDRLPLRLIKQTQKPDDLELALSLLVGVAISSELHRKFGDISSIANGIYRNTRPQEHGFTLIDSATGFFGPLKGRMVLDNTTANHRTLALAIYHRVLKHHGIRLPKASKVLVTVKRARWTRLHDHVDDMAVVVGPRFTHTDSTSDWCVIDPSKEAGRRPIEFNYDLLTLIQDRHTIDHCALSSLAFFFVRKSPLAQISYNLRIGKRKGWLFPRWETRPNPALADRLDRFIAAVA